MAHDVFHHDYSAIHHHAEIERAQRQKVGGNALYVEAGGGKEKRKRNREGDDDRAAHVAQKDKQNEHHQDDAFGEVVQHGVGGEFEEIAAVDQRNQLHARGQDVIVHLLDLGVEPAKRLIGVGAFTKKRDPGNNVRAIDQLPILMANGAGELSQANFRALRDHGNILDMDRRTVLAQNDGVFDVLNVADQTHFTNVDLLRAGLHEAAAGVGIIVGELLLYLSEAEPVVDQLFGIDPNLILARGAAKTGNVHNVGNLLQIFFHHPVFDRFQIDHVICRVGAVQREEINLAHRTPVGTHLRHHACGHSYLGKPLQNAFPVPVVIGIVVEDQLQIRKAKERECAQVSYARDAVHHDFEGNRDLLLDLFGRHSGPLRDDLDVVVGHVGVSLHRKLMEGDGAPAQQHQRRRQYEQPVFQGEIYELADHGWGSSTAPRCSGRPERWRRHGHPV